MVVPPKHPKMIILVGKPMVVGYHHFRNPPNGDFYVALLSIVGLPESVFFHEFTLCTYNSLKQKTLAMHMHAKNAISQAILCQHAVRRGLSQIVSVQFCSCWFGVPIYWRNKTRAWSSKCKRTFLNHLKCVIILDQHFALSFCTQGHVHCWKL